MSSSLTPQQREAVEYDNGPLIVLAGPGTGKTRVIVHRVAHMIESRSIAPEHIAALTFTNKAANELRHRLGEMVGGTASDAIWAGTFHGFGYTLLRRFADLADLPPEPVIMDSAQQRRLLRSLISEHELFTYALGGGLETIVNDAISAIAEMRNAGLEPADARARLETLLSDDQLDPGLRAELQRFADHVRLYELFDQTCATRGVLTVDELITRPARLLRNHPHVRDICQHDHAHIVVDEFQDLNPAQIQLLTQLCPRGTPDLCVVGDDDQAIYAFRGADEFAFQRFEQAWPNAKRILLTENWRSGQAIIDVANAIIEDSTTRFASDKIIEAACDRDEAPAQVEIISGDDAQCNDAIAAMILLDRRDHPESDFSSYAVLVRTHSDAERIAAALSLEGIPTQVLTHPDASADPGVQDLLAWIDLILEPEQTWAARRLLTRPPFGINPLKVTQCERAYDSQKSRLTPGQRMPAFVDWLCDQYADDEAIAPHAERLQDLCRRFADSAAHEAADVTIYRIITEAGLAHVDLPGAVDRAERIDALVAVLRFARERLGRLEQPRDLAAFRRYYNDLDRSEQGFASLVQDRVVESDEPEAGDANGVRVFTAHAAKGLEFDTVFVPRVAPPHGYPKTLRSKETITPAMLVSEQDAPPALEEERRVFYVACTRARRRLVLLGKLPKRPGPTNLLFPLVSKGVATPQFAEDVLKQAADAGVGRFADRLESSELDAVRASHKWEILAGARQHIRLRAALTLDEADSTKAGRAERARIADRLAQLADRLACIAAIERGIDLPDGLDDDTRAFAQSLLDQIAQTQSAGSGQVLRAPNPPLRLSYTSINEYQRCPRCYYVKYVLNVPERVGPALKLGTAVHEALRRFYERWRDADAEGQPTPGLAELLALGRDAFESMHDYDEPIDREEQAQALAQLKTLFEQLHDERSHPVEIERKVEFDYVHAGHTHRLTAKLDRVDQTDAGFRIIDYKTGRATKKLLEPSAKDLQLGIYAIALQHLFNQEALAGTAEFWLLSEGAVGKLNLADIDYEAVHATIRETIDGILNASFERKDSTCSESCLILDAVSR